jgi:hypothetical protein
LRQAGWGPGPRLCALVGEVYATRRFGIEIYDFRIFNRMSLRARNFPRGPRTSCPMRADRPGLSAR